jgi:hypothetical protein
MKPIVNFCLIVMIALFSCAKKESKTTVDQAGESFTASKVIKLETIGMELPKGTKVTNQGDSLLLAELPDGYSYLIAGSKKLPYITIATYKCVCSGIGSTCRVFYQEQVGGFGCIHDNCTGSCTGSFSSKDGKVIGVLNMKNNEITAQKTSVIESASLSFNAIEEFLSNPDIQQIIKEEYDIIYGQLPVPDFSKAESSEDYVYVKALLFGVSFYLLAPREITQLRSIDAIETTASCACSSNAGTCTKKSKGLLGYRLYWCEGTCNGCALTIN